MPHLKLIVLLAITACSSSDDPQPEDNIDSYTDALWRSNSIEFELQLFRGLSAFDVGPFADYDRRFDEENLPGHIVELIKSLDVSLPPNDFPICNGEYDAEGNFLPDEIYVVRVADNNGDERTYMDEKACNLDLIGALPKPGQVVGILDQNQLHDLRNELLEFDPNVFNP